MGPLLFTWFVNDLGNGIDGIVAKFESDMKISRKVASAKEAMGLTGGQTFKFTFPFQCIDLWPCLVPRGGYSQGG